MYTAQCTSCTCINVHVTQISIVHVYMFYHVHVLTGFSRDRVTDACIDKVKPVECSRVESNMCLSLTHYT